MNLNIKLIQIGFLPIGLIDVLDIILVSYVLYKLYFIMRRTRAVPMFIGIAIIFLVSFVAQAINMQETSWIFKNLRTIWLVAFVILFQPELRRLLTLMGQSRFMRAFIKEQPNLVVEEISRATFELSKRGFGGLMVIIRDTGLKAILETGVQLQALVSSALLISIFNPRSPLHDGAVVIRNEFIEAAKCILPLNRHTYVDRRFGTRHRAALGISEESDSLIIVVSEETGQVSFVQNGEILQGLDEKTLTKLLIQAMGYKDKAA
ncbi:TIGR00159 family protein [candidate division KSB1 bacterium]|nr:TIGR00159 family protein [candidate division KSB1 bacterium]